MNVVNSFVFFLLVVYTNKQMKNRNKGVKMKRNKDVIEERLNQQNMRLNKFLSDSGVCSRRQADKLISEGKISVNGHTAQLGERICKEDTVIYQGQKVEIQEEMILIALNKPEGIECTADKNNKDNIVDFIGMKERIYPIGRLDKNSCGLILLTNEGTIMNKILKASNYHEKEYIVTVNKPVTESFLQSMSQGVHLYDTRNGEVILNQTTRECTLKKVSERTFRIVLTQGLNRQIRRMCKVLGYKVTKLERVRIMNIHLGDLKRGAYREVTDRELKDLLKLL